MGLPCCKFVILQNNGYMFNYRPLYQICCCSSTPCDTFNDLLVQLSFIYSNGYFSYLWPRLKFDNIHTTFNTYIYILYGYKTLLSGVEFILLTSPAFHLQFTFTFAWLKIKYSLSHLSAFHLQVTSVILLRFTFKSPQSSSFVSPSRHLLLSLLILMPVCMGIP